MQPRTGEAGATADARYRQLRRSWRRRVLPRYRLILWPLIGFGIAGVALPGGWRWTAGFFTGAVFALWLIVRDSPPQHIERWLDGAQGEKWTAKQLRPLERERWFV